MIVGNITPRMELKNRFLLKSVKGIRFKQIPNSAEVRRRKSPTRKALTNSAASIWSYISNHTAYPKKGIRTPRIKPATIESFWNISVCLIFRKNNKND